MEGSGYSEEMREALKPGVTRLSFPYFMSEEGVDFVIEAVKMTAREGWKLLPQVNLLYTPTTMMSPSNNVYMPSSMTLYQKRVHFATVKTVYCTVRRVSTTLTMSMEK